MTEVIVGTFEALDRFAVFREFAQDGMMQVHGFSSPFFFDGWRTDENRQNGTGRHCSLTKGIHLAESRFEYHRLLDTCAIRVSSRSFALHAIYSQSARSKVIFFEAPR